MDMCVEGDFSVWRVILCTSKKWYVPLIMMAVSSCDHDGCELVFIPSNACANVQGSCKGVVVPRSIPGLVTRRMLVMEFLDGTQITRLASKMKGES